MGLVSSGRYPCGSYSGASYVNITHYLDWIDQVEDARVVVCGCMGVRGFDDIFFFFGQVRVHDLIDEYEASNGSVIPYDRIDSPVFKAMLDQLAKKGKLF